MDTKLKKRITITASGGEVNIGLHEAIQEISKRHREIIEDWCKAYLAELYEAGVDLKPGCFTLNEQMLDNVGASAFGKKYWFEKGTPNYSGWTSMEDKQPPSDELILFVRKGEVGCGWFNCHFDKYNSTHWMPLPAPPKEEKDD